MVIEVSGEACREQKGARRRGQPAKKVKHDVRSVLHRAAAHVESLPAHICFADVLGPRIRRKSRTEHTDIEQDCKAATRMRRAIQSVRRREATALLHTNCLSKQPQQSNNRTLKPYPFQSGVLQVDASPEEVVERAKVGQPKELAGDGGQQGQVAAVREANEEDARVERPQVCETGLTCP